MIRRDAAGPVAYVTIDDRGTRNALGVATLRDLAAAVVEAAADPATRVIVLSGANGTFSSGANLKERAEIEEVIVAVEGVYDAIHTSRLPVLARVEGTCLGLGVGVAAACDLVIVSETAHFALPEVRLGQVPTLAALTVLPRLRVTDANHLLLTGAGFDGAHAAAIGLANRAVPAVDLEDEVARWVDQLTAGGPSALAASKALIHAVSEADRLGAVRFAQDLTRTLAASPEAAEGRAAFVERRDPAWVSRHTALSREPNPTTSPEEGKPNG